MTKNEHDLKPLIDGCYKVKSRAVGTGRSTKTSWWNVVCIRCGTDQTVSRNSIRRNPSYCRYCTNKPRTYPLKLMECAVCTEAAMVDSRKYVHYCSYLCHRKAINSRYSSSRRGDVEGTLRKLLIQIKARSKKKGLEFDLDFEFLQNLLRQSYGKCAVSGLELTPSREDLSGLRGIYPTTVSIDRIDSTRGYTKDNVQLVAYIYNICKNRFIEKDVLDMCIGVLEKAGYTVLSKEGTRQ